MNGTGTWDLTSVDIRVLLGAGPIQYIDFLLFSSGIAPGEPVSFAWRVVRSNIPAWVSADLELLLAQDSDEEHLWNQRHIAWPPVVVTEPSDWPPIGYKSEEARLLGGARSTLYSGLGTKTLILRITGRDAAGRTLTLENRETVEIVPATDLALAVALTAPSVAEWNSPYSVTATGSNPTSADMHVDLSVTGDDGSSFSAVRMDLSARSDRRTAIVTSPIPQNWQWVDKPNYHVRAEQIARRITYSVTSIWTDEFGNRYEEVAGRPLTTRVNVSERKQHAANVSEGWFWTTVALSACAAIAGGLSSIPYFGAIAAGVAIGCGLDAIGSGVLATHWAQIADDPPYPDLNYRFLEVVPEVGKKEDGDSPMDRFLESSLRLAKSQLAASVTTGRVLGARLDGKDEAEKLQMTHFDELRAETFEVLRELKQLTMEAQLQAAKEPSLDPGKISDTLQGWRKAGWTPKQRDAFRAGLGDSVAADIEKFVTENDIADRMPPMPSLIGALSMSMAIAAGEGLQALTDLIKAARKL
jgi:hypothetical protein